MYMLGAGAEPTANLQAMSQRRGFENAEAQARAMATIKQAKIEAASRMQALGLTNQNEEANRALERYRIDGSQASLREARLQALGIHQSDQAQALGIHKSDQAQHAGEFAQNLKMEQERNLSQTGNQAALLDQHARDEANRNAIAKRTADREDLRTYADPNTVDYFDENPELRPAPPVPDSVMHPFEQSPVGSDPMKAFGGNTPSTRPNPVPAGVDPNKPPSWFKPQAAPSAPTSGPDSPPAGGLQSNALSTFAQGASDMYPKPSVPTSSIAPQVRMSATRPEEWGPPAPSAPNLSTIMQDAAPVGAAGVSYNSTADDRLRVRHGRPTQAVEALTLRKLAADAEGAERENKHKATIEAMDLQNRQFAVRGELPPLEQAAAHEKLQTDAMRDFIARRQALTDQGATPDDAHSQALQEINAMYGPRRGFAGIGSTADANAVGPFLPGDKNNPASTNVPAAFNPMSLQFFQQKFGGDVAGTLDREASKYADDRYRQTGVLGDLAKWAGWAPVPRGDDIAQTMNRRHELTQAPGRGYLSADAGTQEDFRNMIRQKYGLTAEQINAVMKKAWGM